MDRSRIGAFTQAARGGLICDFRHAESLERKSPAGAGLEACPSGKAPLLILGGLTEKRSPNRNRAEAR